MLLSGSCVFVTYPQNDGIKLNIIFGILIYQHVEKSNVSKNICLFLPGLLQRCEVKSGSSSRDDSVSVDNKESEEDNTIHKKPSMKRPAAKEKPKEDDSELVALGTCKGNKDDEDDEDGCAESDEPKKKKKKKKESKKSKPAKKVKKESSKKERKSRKHGKKRADNSCGSDEPTSTESASDESGKVSQDEHQEEVTADMLADAFLRAHEAEKNAMSVPEARSSFLVQVFWYPTPCCRPLRVNFLQQPGPQTNASSSLNFESPAQS